MNDKQREAVTTTEGPVLVLAGAGSGKTRVLTERIAYLIDHVGVSPRNILAFTFTNKAAREMKERLERRIPGAAAELWVGTFHSTGVKILRRDGERIGVPRNFSIYDSTDSLNLIRNIVSRHSMEGSVLRSVNSLQSIISNWKCELIDPARAHEEALSNVDRETAFVYEQYEKELAKAKALDFDDLIVKVVRLFSLHPEVRDRYARRFTYVLVDEFQDTNPVQMLMIDGLSSYKRNLFVVGDDDQSIYSWRGARVEHILEFEKLYPGTTLIRLEQNYRSTGTILRAANQVIGFNRARKGKNLWTDGEEGEKIRLMESLDEEAEAVNILNVVHELAESGYQYRDIAVLYRTNAQSRAIEDVMKMGGVPYQIIGSVRFYERAEVRDVLAYCKVIANPADSVSLRRIINVPRRAIGKTTVEALEREAAERGVTMMELLLSGDNSLSPPQQKRCSGFAVMMKELIEMAKHKPAPDVIEAVITKTGYRSYLERSYNDSESRIENVNELVAAADAFAEGGEDGSLEAFLQEIALVADIDNLDEEKGLLTLMTLHNAKGLEFDCVIIAGLEDGLFPHYNSIDNERSLEEERRLFYVGMTRARKLLYLSYANMRRRMGSMNSFAPSRFLFEIPDELLEVEAGSGRGGSAGYMDGEMDGYVQSKFGGAVDAPYFGAQAHPDYENSSQEQISYEVGMRVEHDDFGRGIVRRIDRSGGDLRVTVFFDGGGERKFIARLAPMRPI